MFRASGWTLKSQSLVEGPDEQINILPLWPEKHAGHNWYDVGMRIA